MRDGMMVADQAVRAGNGGGRARAAGWSVPGYTGLKKLGSGGFCDVVLARHDESGTLVAIKYLRRELLSDAEFAEMFRGEAAVLASMNDPHVVRLHEYVESPSGAAIVMELVDGVSLRDILERHGATTPEAALVVLQGSLLGLAAAHARGVVHRDYKPDNVLVNGAGASKLTDFGIAVRAGDRSMPAGTLMYAAPEQIAGDPATPAGDVYAATATFFECLTGRPPFRGDTPESLLYQHISEPVPVDAVPEPVRPLIAAGMAKQPEDRPADATSFVTALNSVAAGAYGPEWQERGRSHLAEAALLLAALWPSGGPAAVQGSTVARTPLCRRNWRSRLRRSGAVKTAIAVTMVGIAAAGTILGFALTRSSSYAAALPAVTGASPGSGSTAGGTTVTITGTGLADATGISFGGVAGRITADSGMRITVTSPPRPGTAHITADSGTRVTATGAGTVDITVTTPAGTSPATATGRFTYIAPRPAVTGVSPDSGSTAGGTTLSITGTGLAGATGVSFGGVAGLITADSSTQITVTSPSGTGTVTIAVTTPAGTSRITAVGHYAYTTRPKLAQSIFLTAPASGTAGGSAVLSATGGGSGNPVVFSVDSGGGPGVCTADGTSVTFTGAGSCVLDANQAGNARYAAAPQVQRTITVMPAPGSTRVPPQTPPQAPAQAPTVTPAQTPTQAGNPTPTTPAAAAPSPASGWTAAEGTLPGDGTGGGFESVACPSASACVATGGYNDSSGTQAMLETGLGSSWTDVAVSPPVGGSAPYLDGVACPSATQCVVAGQYTDSSGGTRLMALTGYGSSWTTTEMPLPANASTSTDQDSAPVQLYAVACASTSQCTAVGMYTDTAGFQQGLLLTGYGSSWTATEAPLPSDASASYDPNAALLAVTCPSSSQCVAVGTYDDPSGQYGLLLSGSGSSWTPQQEPGQTLQAVTCPSAAACVAVGGAIVTGSGSSWTATSAPLPSGVSGSNFILLTGVSCESASSCVAVGSYMASSSTSSGGYVELPWLVTGSGSSWTAASTPLPAGASSSSETGLDSVSCPSASGCVAVGTYADANGNGQIVLMFGSGSSWSAVEGPLPGNAVQVSSDSKIPGPPQARSLTCLSTSSCIAVGEYGGPNQGEPLLLSGPPSAG